MDDFKIRVYDDVYIINTLSNFMTRIYLRFSNKLNEIRIFVVDIRTFNAFNLLKESGLLA